MKHTLLAALFITTTVFSAQEALADRRGGDVTIIYKDGDRGRHYGKVHDGRNYYNPRYRKYIDPYYPSYHKGHKPWKHGHGKHWNKKYGRYDDDDDDVIIFAPQFNSPPSYYDDSGYYYDTQPPVGRVRTVEFSCGRSSNLAGQILGGVGGGVLGHQIGDGRGQVAATIGGTLIGSVLGGQLTTSDRRCTHQVFEYGNPGQQIAWSNPNNNHNYSFIPQEPYQVQGRYCREYQAVATVGGRRQETYGTACRQPDGDWEIVK